MKIIIASPHCTKLDLMEYQHKSIQKFVHDIDYEYVIFNDASTEKNLCNFYQSDINEQIHHKCEMLHIKCVDIPQHLHTHRNEIFSKTKAIS